MSAFLRFDGYRTYCDSDNVCRTWEILEPMPEIEAGAGCWLYDDGPDRERSHRFHVRRPDCSEKFDHIVWLDEHHVGPLFGPEGPPAWDPPPNLEPLYRAGVLSVLRTLEEECAMLRRLYGLRPVDLPHQRPRPEPPQPKPQPEEQQEPEVAPEALRARAFLAWDEKPGWGTSAALLALDVPEVDAKAGDLLVYADNPALRPQVRGTARELTLEDYERLAAACTAPGALLNLYPSYWTNSTDLHECEVTKFLQDRRKWGHRLKVWHSRLLLVRPWRETISKPIVAETDLGAIFELLHDAGGRMPEDGDGK